MRTFPQSGLHRNFYFPCTATKIRTMIVRREAVNVIDRQDCFRFLGIGLELAYNESVYTTQANGAFHAL